MVSNTVRAASTATVLASEPDDHLADGEPVKHRVVAPAPLTLLPHRAQVDRFLGLGLGKDDFIGVPHGDERGGNVLDGLGHEALPLCQQYNNKAPWHQQQHSPDTHCRITLTRTVVKATRRQSYDR